MTIVVDAGVWISYTLPKDLNHATSRTWLTRRLLEGIVVAPSIILPEIGGAIARQTGDKSLAYALYRRIFDLPNMRVEPIDHDLANLSAHIAIALNLRGADSVYVALAKTLDVPLFTWDSQQRERASAVISARSPDLN